MKRLFSILIITLLFSCSEDDNISVNENNFYGTWEEVSFTTDGETNVINDCSLGFDLSTTYNFTGSGAFTSHGTCDTEEDRGSGSYTVSGEYLTLNYSNKTEKYKVNFVNTQKARINRVDPETNIADDGYTTIEKE